MDSNPFTPGRPTSTAFRDRVAQESARIVAGNGGAVPNDRSLCLRNPDGDAQALRNFGYMVLMRLILGFVGLVGGALLALLDQRTNQGNDEISTWLILGACCSISGILILSSNGFFQRRFVRRHLAMRYDDLASRATYGSPICIGIENAETFSKMKFVPEDLGYLALDPARQMVIIEGVLYRYVVCSADVQRVEQVTGGASSATAIDYAVGDTVLKIALQYDSLWHEFKRQTIGAKDPLVARIRETLGIEIG